MALAMVVIVAVISLFTLLITQNRVNAVYSEVLTNQFEEQAKLFFAKRDARLSAARDAIADALRNVRLVAAVQAKDYERFNSDLTYELSEILDRYAHTGSEAYSGPVPFFRFIHANVEAAIEAGADAGFVEGLSESELCADLARLAVGIDPGVRDEVGYLTFGEDRNRILYEVLVSPLMDEHDGDAYLGSLVFGVPVMSVAEFASGGAGQKNAVMLPDFFFSDQIREEDHESIMANIKTSLLQQFAGTPDVSIDGIGHRVFFRALTKGERFPQAFGVSVYSLAGLQSNLKQLRAVMLVIASVALLIGIGLSLFAAHHMTRPILDLVNGTEAIQAGDFEFRIPVKSHDEIGLLTRSFNAMGAELELKERYKSVLDKVTDRDVADELISGSLDLGGEERETSVLFCDIRGFTPLTEGMRPAEVITMLNEHMTALTGVVYAHHGVVDKFVGDEIMVMFGAPRSYGDDVLNAARCALEMVRQREELNASGNYRIGIGIGVATGEVVAGCMGSEDRLNYTVLGENVNLASRLCGAAGPGEVLIGGVSRARLGDRADADRLPELTLKGFAGEVEAYRLNAINPKGANAFE